MFDIDTFRAWIKTHFVRKRDLAAQINTSLLAVNQGRITVSASIADDGTPHTLGTIALGAGGAQMYSLLLTIAGTGTGRLAICTYVLTVAWTTESLDLVSDVLFGFTSLTPTATHDPGTGITTIALTQDNPGAQTCVFTMTVQPLYLYGNKIITVA